MAKKCRFLQKHGTLEFLAGGTLVKERLRGTRAKAAESAGLPAQEGAGASASAKDYDHPEYYHKDAPHVK